MLYNTCYVYYITPDMLCYMTWYVMLYDTCNAMLYNTWYVTLYDTCNAILYNTCYVIRHMISYVI